MVAALGLLAACGDVTLFEGDAKSPRDTGPEAETVNTDAADTGAADAGGADTADTGTVDPGSDDTGSDDGPCVPRTCSDMEPACGMIENGCGIKIICSCEPPESCGGAGIDAQCGRTIDVGGGGKALLDVQAPGPFLAVWPSATVLASNLDGDALQVEIDGGKTSKLQLHGSRPTIWKRGTEGGLVLHSGNKNFGAMDESGAPKYTASHKWARKYPEGFSIVAEDALWYTPDGREVTLDSGQITRPLEGPSGRVIIVGDTLYQLGMGFLTRRDRGDLAVLWSKPVGPQPPSPISEGCSDGAGGVVVVSEDAGLVARFLRDGTNAWEHPIDFPGAPVLGQDAIVFVPARNTASPAIRAFGLEDGETVFIVPLTGMASSMFVADDNHLYAAIETRNEIIGIDVFSGDVVRRYSNVPTPKEILLYKGMLIAHTGARVLVIDASDDMANYQPGSAWPVRFHDNFRTSRAFE